MSETVIDGKYRVLRLLGQGGMGAVYEAEHQGTARRVAVKSILTTALAQDEGMLARFRREARASGAIDSQHVVQVLDTGVDPTTGSPYMVMELLSGEDAHELVHRLGPLSPDFALRMTAQACLGIDRAHEAGIIHRDIKSANIFLARRENGERIVKVLDFGIAKVRADNLSGNTNHALTQTGAMLGSPLYMSPEQARGSKNVDRRSDIWSVGVMLYELLCGVTPNGHCETLGDLIIAIVSERPRPVQDKAPWVAPEIVAIVERALTPDPNARFQTAREMHAAITALLPNGYGIHESMVAGVSPAMRAYVAPRFAGSPPASALSSSGSPMASTSALADSRPSAENRSTTAGFGSATPMPLSSPPPGTSSKVAWLVPIALIALMGGGAAAALRWKHLHSQAPPVSSESSVVVAPASAPPSAGTPGGEPSVRIVAVTVAPADASVTVDGVPAPVTDGRVEIHGALGSMHDTRISLGARETTTRVAITESGAMPARIELPPAPSASAAARPAVAAAAAPVRPPPTPASAAARPTGGATGSAKTPTGPAIDRGM